MPLFKVVLQKPAIGVSLKVAESEEYQKRNRRVLLVAAQTMRGAYKKASKREHLHGVVWIVSATLVDDVQVLSP
jgi:hypothetical protein